MKRSTETSYDSVQLNVRLPDTVLCLAKKAAEYEGQTLREYVLGLIIKDGSKLDPTYVLTSIDAERSELDNQRAALDAEEASFLTRRAIGHSDTNE